MQDYNRPFKNTVAVFFFILACSCPASAALGRQVPAEARAQIQRQAQLVAMQPVKVQIAMLTPDVRVGAKLRMEITVLNARNEPVAAPSDWECEVLIRFPSGRVSSQTVSIKKGEESTQSEAGAAEAGLTSIQVRPLFEQIRSDKIEVIIRPAKGQKGHKLHGALAPFDRPYAEFSLGQDAVPVARIEMTSLVPQPTEESPALPPSQDRGEGAPVLHFSWNDPNGYYRANGRDAAIITVTFESPDLSAAPTDIHVWFHWTGGSLDPPQPLEIKKGAFSATAQLTSVWPGDVHFAFVSSTPTYLVQGDTDSVIHFIPPGAALVGPDKLSVVDNTPIMIVFYDAQENPVAPGRDWAVTLRSSQSKLRFLPQSFQVRADSPLGSVALFPISWGNDRIDAVVADYTLQPLNVIITGWLVLGLCLGGGLAGGLAAYNKFRGSWMWRIFLGALGGAILCWLYVYLALPNVDVNIAHNTFSVFFVALMGGYGGTSVLDFAAKQLGWLGAGNEVAAAAKQ